MAWHHGARLGSYRGEDYDEKVWSYVFSGREDCDESPYTFVSHGCGHYGHPHHKTISAISQCGADVFCTQLREGLVKDADERRDAMSAAGLDVHLGMADEWDVYRINSNACSGNITAKVSDTGKISVICGGPRQRGNASNSSCCLFSAHKEVPTDEGC